MVNKHTRVISQRGQYSGYDVSYLHTRIWKHELAFIAILSRRVGQDRNYHRKS